MRAIVLLSIVGLLPFTANAENNNPKILFKSSDTHQSGVKFSRNKLVINHWLKSDSVEGFSSVFKEQEKPDFSHGISFHDTETYQGFDLGLFTTYGHHFSWGEDFGGLLKTRFSRGLNFNDMYAVKYFFENKNHFFNPGCTPPIPEASTWQMMFAGLALLGFVSRRRINSIKKLNIS